MASRSYRRVSCFHVYRFCVAPDVEAEIPMRWPPDAKSWVIWKDPDAGKDWGQEEKGKTGWDSWMASPTPWTWVWVDSGSWWWTGRPGVLRFMGSQKVGHDWATELNSPSQPPSPFWGQGLGFSHHSSAEIMFFLSSSSRSLILWDNRRARLTLLDSPQTTNTLDTESPSRNASRCSWPSSRAPSSEDVLTFHVSSAACQPPRDFLQPGSSVCEPGSLLRHLLLESGLIFAFDYACCEAVMVASLSNGRYLNLFVPWITARLLKWFQRAVILYVVGRKEWFKKKKKKTRETRGKSTPGIQQDRLEEKLGWPLQQSCCAVSPCRVLG